MRIWHTAPLCVLLAGCPTGDDDDSTAVSNDDDATVADDDDATPPDPLADVIGVFNLTNVVRADGTSYIDFSGAFGTFPAEDVQPFAPAGYLETFEYGADAPFWRFDLGGWPLPVEGEWAVVTPSSWLAWLPAEQTWWDGGTRVGLGNYLAQRLDFEDVRAYQVDDPLVPGAAAWTPGATLAWDNLGGDEVVGWSAPDGVPLPDAGALLSPAESSSSTTPAALPYTVTWTPGTDGSYVTLSLVRDLFSSMWVAQVPDTGEYEIPAEILHTELGPGEATVVLGRTLDTVLPHPQGDILVRTREERRATVELLEDVQVDPAFGQPGESVTVSVDWWTTEWQADAAADFGEGIAVISVEPDGANPHRVTIELDVAADALLGGRDVVLTSGADEVTVLGAFTLLDLLPQDTCEDAIAGDPLSIGIWQSTTAGATNDLRGYGCIPWSLGGADVLYAVDLAEGETLGLILDAPAPVDAAIALLEDCSDGLTALTCADEGLEGDPEFLAFTAPADGTWYIAVDGYFFANEEQAFGGPFTLTVQIESTVLDPAWLLVGESDTFTLTGEQDWSGPTPADVSFGEGIVVEAVSPAGPPRDLAILATSAPTAETGPRDVTVEDPTLGTVTYESALYVTDWPAFDACLESVGDTMEVGTGTGYAPAITNSINEVACLDFPSEGPDVVLPIDLTLGQHLTATAVSADDLQLYVMSDCADAESCLVGVDDTVDNEEEVVEFDAPADGRYYLVVDVYGGLLNALEPLVYDLTIAID